MMFLLWFFRWRSKTFGLVVLLPVKLRLFREPICKIVCFEQCVCLESGQCVSQDMILPKYCFATISFCQSMILPKYHVAKVLFCHNIILPKYHFAKVLFLPKYGDANRLSHISWGRCLHWYIEITSIPLHLRIILCGFHQVTSQGRWFHRNHHPL